MEDPKESLTKQIRRRFVWWLIGGALIIWTVENFELAFPLALAIFLLVDEKLKEGYWIKRSDFKKPFTHEWLLAVLVGITTLAEVVKALLRRRKYDRDERDRG